MIGGRGFLHFVLIAITKMDILYMFYHFQDPIKVIRRYEGCHYTRLESYYIIFYFETDWSRIRPLPSTTLKRGGICLNVVTTKVYDNVAEAQIFGKTNHSLRATGATTLPKTRSRKSHSKGDEASFTGSPPNL